MSIESIKVRDLNTTSSIGANDLLLVAKADGTTQNVKISDLFNFGGGGYIDTITTQRNYEDLKYTYSDFDQTTQVVLVLVYDSGFTARNTNSDSPTHWSGSSALGTPGIFEVPVLTYTTGNSSSLVTSGALQMQVGKYIYMNADGKVYIRATTNGGSISFNYTPQLLRLRR